MSSGVSQIRFRLLIIALVTVLPCAALMVVNAVADYRRQTSDGQEQALRIARVVAATQEASLEGGRQLLVSLAQAPVVRSGDAAECSVFLGQLLSRYSQYANLGVATAQGNVYCSAAPFLGTVNIADRSYFRKAIETGTFALGDFQIGRVTGRPAVTLGFPVVDDGGTVQAVVFASYDLASLNRLAEEVKLPDGAVLTVTDANGTVLVRYPESEQWVGQTLPSSSIIATMLSGREGTTVTSGVDGVERVYGYTTLGRDGSRAFLAVGLPAAGINSVATRTLLGTIAILVLATLIACLLAQLSGEALIQPSFARLVALVNRQSQRDPATGMFSRTVFMQHLRQALDKSAGRNARVGLLLIDLDRFRAVNETLGRTAGDHVLAQVGQRLVDAGRVGDIVARYGEDEFVILLEGLREDGDAQAVARKVLDRSQAPFVVKNANVALTLSVGVAINEPACDEDELLRRAKVAVYEAKIEGGACSVLYGGERGPHRGNAYAWQPGLGR